MGRGKAFQSLGANTMKALSPDEVKGNCIDCICIQMYCET